MQALIWDGDRLRFVPDAPAPHPTPGTALVRVRLAGICSTDLQILRGYMGFRGVLGHEFVGEVIDGPAHLRSRRVVGEINFACGRCPDCVAGRRRHCPTRRVMGILGADGAMAQVLRVPIENLHLVPDAIGDLSAAFVEPLAAAIEASQQSRQFAGARSLVLGAGKLGLLIAQVLARRGDQVRVVCRNARATAIVEALGLTPITSPEGPRLYDLVVDATGDDAGLGLALESVRPLGGVVIKSTIAKHYAVDLAPLVINEVTLIGSRCGDFDAALAALASGDIRVELLVDAIHPLEDGTNAIERAGKPGALKILLEPAS